MRGFKTKVQSYIDLTLLSSSSSSGDDDIFLKESSSSKSGNVDGSMQVLFPTTTIN